MTWTGPDAKPAKRIVNRSVFDRFHAQNPSCLLCDTRSVQAHHVLSRAQGGDDTLRNLVGLCGPCHGALHGQPYREEWSGRRIEAADVRAAIARFVRSDAGEGHAAYLIEKLGPFVAEWFVQKLEGAFVCVVDERGGAE